MYTSGRTGYGSTPLYCLTLDGTVTVEDSSGIYPINDPEGQPLGGIKHITTTKTNGVYCAGHDGAVWMIDRLDVAHASSVEDMIEDGGDPRFLGLRIPPTAAQLAEAYKIVADDLAKKRDAALDEYMGMPHPADAPKGEKRATSLRRGLGLKRYHDLTRATEIVVGEILKPKEGE